MKDVLIIAQFTTFRSEGGNNRFNYITEELCKEKGICVELVTSTFFHKKKQKRDDVIENGYRVTLVDEPGYRKNVSLRRLYSHYMFGRNLKCYLKKRSNLDCIYCAVPSLSAAETVSRYARRNNIKMILDVQDLWPEAFEMVVSDAFFFKVIFLPMRLKANRIYKSADELVAVSETYVKRAQMNGGKSKKGHVVFLGTDLQYFDSIPDRENTNAAKKFRVVYIGTLGHSYNIKAVIDAIEHLYEQGVRDIQFLVMGDGPMMETLREYVKSVNIDVVFTGFVPYEEMVQELRACHIAVNPIVRGSAGSIINKVGDYAAAALPVVNSQECDEYRELLEKYEAGINCRCDDWKDIAMAIQRLHEDENLRRRMAVNSRKLAEDRFDRANTYREIINLIKNA